MAIVDALKSTVNFLTNPPIYITLVAITFLLALRTRWVWRPRVALIAFPLAALFIAVSMLDPNFYLIVRKADNVPIVAMLFLVGFFVWLAMYQAVKNDELIAQG